MSGMLLLCNKDVNKWYRYIVIGGCVYSGFELGIWLLWKIVGRNPLVVIEQVNAG